MSHELKEGLKLKRVVGIPDAQGTSTYKVGVESHHCKEIVVVMQVGQMSMVPWARAEMNNGEVVLVNLANVESVTPEKVEP